MELTSLTKNLKEVFRLGVDISLGRYPSFVYGSRMGADEIPVFCFHSAEAVSFENMLRYLKDNDYQTITADEYYEILSKGNPNGWKRPVMLTFDDGMGSVWSVAYPLLKKYGFVATVFLIPGKINEGRECGPTLEDVWSGKRILEEVISRECGDEPLANWKEIEKMHDSGVIDFQSHTTNHSLVFSSSVIKDFVTPAHLERYHPHEFPLEICESKINKNYSLPKLGSPLYASAPRMSGAHRYWGDPKLRNACIEYVGENGGDRLFESKDWKKQLNRIASEHQKSSGSGGYWESVSEREAEMVFELRRSKQMIEERLSGKKVRHLCFPWEVACAYAVDLAKKEGFIASYWGRMNGWGRRWNPYQIARMGEDFFYLMPGRGRLSLTQVIGKKFRKRLTHGSPYLVH